MLNHPVFLKRYPIKEPQRGDGNVEGAPRKTSLDQMHLKATDMRGAQLIG
jgi:hypothetical protein